MVCNKYKEALIEAAASGAVLPGVVLEHVKACLDCREALSSQQMLLGAIDGELRSRMNRVVPANFDHRVRAALEPGNVPRRPGYSAILAFGSVAAVAAVMMASFHVYDANQVRKANTRTTSEQARQFGPNRQLAARNGNKGQVVSPEGLQSRSIIRQGAKRLTGVAKGDGVLVPEGQEELVVQYMQILAARNPRVTIRAELSAEPNMKPVEVAPVEISQLTVKPLPDLGSK